MSRVLLLLVIATLSSCKPAENQASKNANIKDSLQKLREVVKDKLTPTSRKSKDIEPENSRKAKNYGYYPYMPNPYMPNYNYPNDLGYYYPQSKTPMPQEWRTEPFKRKNTQQLLDSPVYYVRLPPSPYVFVPGMGYVSRPPSLNEPGLLNSIAESKPDSSSSGDITPENFLHVPVDFVSNGKPTNIYQLPNDPIKQKPDSSIYNLDKGPYLFNGKPIELFVLGNSYNQMYAEALTNFYP